MVKTLDCGSSNESSILFSHPKYGAVAQLVEHWTENPSVVGSIPICPTIYGVLGKLVKPSSLQGDNCEFESRTRPQII